MRCLFTNLSNLFFEKLNIEHSGQSCVFTVQPVELHFVSTCGTAFSPRYF